MNSLRHHTICTLAELVQILRPIALTDLSSNEVAIQRVLTDSRSLIESCGTIFFALRTPTGDGHLYIEELYRQGIRLFAIEQELAPYKASYPEATFLQVGHTLSALQSLAQAYRQKFTYPLIGITGSNGKTIVKEMLASLLHNAFPKLSRSPGSYNSQLGVALSLLELTEEAGLGLIEAGISAPNEMQRLSSMIAPDYVVLTHLGSAHQNNFTSREARTREKLQLALGKELKHIYASYDDREATQAISELGLNNKLISYSLMEHPEALLKASYETHSTQTLLHLELKGKCYEVLAPFGDRANIENLLLSLTLVAHLTPYIWLDALALVPQLRPIEMRLELQASNGKATLINDSYSCDVDSLEIALDFMRRRASVGKTSTRLGIILSDIDQATTADYQGKLHDLLKRYDIRQVYTIGQLSEALPCTGFEHRKHYASVELLLADTPTLRLATSSSFLLIKGARRFGFERIVRNLSKREHQTQLEVNLTALKHNLNYYRGLLPPSHPIICMIKADAYGLGAYEIAKTLEENHAHALAVALVDEGKELRHKGITLPIIVMNPELSSLETLLRYQLDLEVYSPELLEALLASNIPHSYQPHVHLKVETGMHRLGLSEEAIPTIAKLYHQAEGRIKLSAFSHLAVADDLEQEAFTHQQAERLKHFGLQLERAIRELMPTLPKAWHIPLHLLNTAGIERFAELYPLDGVRLGIGLYGYDPLGGNALEPVASLSTTILQIKEVAPLQGIGYGLGGVCTHTRRIAILPIGYADGLPRRLSHEAWQVALHGKLCPIVGRICMDICMIDISDIPEAVVGDRVNIFGGVGTPLEAMAEASDTITYEILTGISPRVPRLYLKE